MNNQTHLYEYKGLDGQFSKKKVLMVGFQRTKCKVFVVRDDDALISSRL